MFFQISWWMLVLNLSNIFVSSFVLRGSRDFLYLVCRYIRTRLGCFLRFTEIHRENAMLTGQSFLTPWSRPCLSRLDCLSCKDVQRSLKESHCFTPLYAATKRRSMTCFFIGRFVAWTRNFQQKSLMLSSRPGELT